MKAYGETNKYEVVEQPTTKHIKKTVKRARKRRARQQAQQEIREALN